MVANLSTSKAGFEDKKGELGKIATKGQMVKDSLVKAIDNDTSAFDLVIKAMRMPKDSDEERKIRDEAMQEGYKVATNVPLETVEYCKQALEVCHDISKIMDQSMASDVGSGALMANAGAVAAAFNVRINLKEIEDESYCKITKESLEEMLTKSKSLSDKIIKTVEKTL